MVMVSMSNSNALTDLEDVRTQKHELKAVQAARMSTLVLALLTTIVTIAFQY